MANTEIPSFAKINKYNVAIASLQNQLKASTSIDELTSIASKIIEFEQQVILEKTLGYKKLEKEKQTIENKIDKIRRELKRAEDDLQRVGNNLDLKVNGMRKTLQLRIESLNEEYNELVNKVTN